MFNVRRTQPRSTHHSTPQLDADRYQHVSVSEGKDLLDRQARKYLGMSGEEFRRAYREGSIDDPDRSEVIRVSLLLPFAEGSENGQEEHSQ